MGNALLLLAMGLTFLPRLALIYVPFLNPIFKTTPLSLAVASLVFLAVEIEKGLIRRSWIYTVAPGRPGGT